MPLLWDQRAIPHQIVLLIRVFSDNLKGKQARLINLGNLLRMRECTQVLNHIRLESLVFLLVAARLLLLCTVLIDILYIRYLIVLHLS